MNRIPNIRSAVHLFLVHDGQVLLSRRSNTGYEDGKLSVVAGKLDGGEQVIEAAGREALEEAGLRLRPEDIRVVGVMHRKTSFDEWIDFFVEVEQWEGEPVNTEPHKCSELRWCGLDELPDDVVPYVRRALNNYRNGIWFDSCGWEAEA
jgi:8-oxo-dGTP pyrophosphatase MutT (NUDIX family)